ncbi:hypothetical protein ESA94_16950 [Lacibacter luteus]|uniref:Uncharacterized protein n=1 Tax=Lacibacter luteus TaxID=2508719 RepID=A0A4V1M752_9BACT|nr:baseplate J/gp47 family protein [Lacibacter luteus]RXK58330.1 hypothetical protein ESA94_16950 [Lacibacter luteus]
MSGCKDQKNPLQRNGISRADRLLPGMTNGYVNVDENSFAAWIVFAKEFAQYLQYYGLSDTVEGDWTPFFSSDVSAVLGTIALQDTDAYRRSIKDRFDFLKDDDHAELLPKAERKLNELFCAIVSFSEALDIYYRQLPDDVALKSSIENNIRNLLAPALQRLLRYYKAADAAGYLLAGNLSNWQVMGKNVKDVKLITDGNGLSELWWMQPKAPAAPFTTWAAYYASITADATIFGNAALDLYFDNLYIATTDYTQAQWRQYMKMNHAANHNLFSSVFDQYLMQYSKLVKDSEKELLLSLENRNTHAPHYALFLAFLRLFRFAQNDLNTITWRHLDLYYKEILQLKPKAALPNSAHVIAELAKPVDEFILANDTLFKAGKDSEGKEVLYALDDEETFNKAKVVSLRSVYLGKAEDDHASESNPAVTVTNSGRLFAAPVINSADGNGAELTSTNKEWHPIANRLYVEGKVTDVQMPLAEIGFAVASHYLYLQEGERKIMLRLDTSDNNALTGKQYSCLLTTEKGWYKVASVITVAAANKMENGTKACTEISFTLNGSEPPISNYNAALHGGTLNVQLPVLKIVLVNDEASAYQYTALRDVEINKVEIAVEVGMGTSAFNQKGLKQLLISTDAGPVDASKPFMPFGAQPRTDATLVIGNKELFTKKNASVKLNIEWGGISGFLAGDIDFDAGWTSDEDYPSTRFSLLQSGEWIKKESAVDLFNGNASDVQIFSSAIQIPQEAVSDYATAYTNYAADSVQGFMRFTLNAGFGHKQFIVSMADYLIAKANGTASGNAPVEPYTPIIQSMHISYAAYSDVVDLNSSNETDYSAKQISFFHLYPFGDAEQHNVQSKQLFHYLLPQFRHTDETSKPVLHEGEFYIGFEKLGAQQSVNVLFQVMDGTANPKITKPVEHLHWSYLSNNQWKAFTKQQVSDATLQLLQSGIISFIIPADATTANSLMSADYLWIKAAVAEKSDAVCKLLSVDAQAAVVTFRDKDNADDFLNTALAASTISKLKTPVAAVKKLTQPYSSFGGRALEGSESFYIRVSERLRHKARAITIWDYEHLILEAFPLIHKVKCLNHTKSVDAEFNEVLPGHVTIITIPDVQHRNDINPLRPYTNQDVLLQIDAFLRKRISCHVQLHVVNPDFEEVQLKFKLRLAKGYDDFTIYSNKLREEITSFLSPWAYGAGELDFGGKVYKSVLINFIEERPYVDFITDVEMAHYDANNVLVKADNDEIIASTGKSILVSVAASKHVIEEIPVSSITEPAECAYIEALNNQS